MRDPKNSAVPTIVQPTTKVAKFPQVTQEWRVLSWPREPELAGSRPPNGLRLKVPAMTRMNPSAAVTGFGWEG